jgi:hypothetical protein
VAPKVPPPFPVVAPPTSGKSNPPIPHVEVSKEVSEPEPPPAPGKPPAARKKVFTYLGLTILIGVAVAYWFYRDIVGPVELEPAREKAVRPPGEKAPAPRPPSPKSADAPPAGAAPGPVTKVQDVLKAREDSGQSQIEFGDSTATATPLPATRPAAVSTQLAPGIAATMQVEAAAEASAAFKSFVANARITAVLGGGTDGPSSRAIVNGRLTRIGETVDARLGISLEHIDEAQRQLVFKDRSGATVARKY